MENLGNTCFTEQTYININFMENKENIGKIGSFHENQENWKKI